VKEVENEKEIIGFNIINMALFSKFCIDILRICRRSTEYEETMYVYVFFSAHPGKLRLMKNIHLLFENMTTGPSINKNIQALNDRFLELEFKANDGGGGISFSIFNLKLFI